MMNQYDEYLKQVIHHLANHWMNPDVGIVGAGVFNPSYPPILATSQQMVEGKWLHAERKALQKYVSNYGLPDKETTIVVTLSPCIKPISKSRIGDACTVLLRKLKITKVYAGAFDLTQGIDDISEYAKHGLNVSVTHHQQYKEICQKIYNIFNTYGNRVNYDLLNIKKELGKSIFGESYDYSNKTFFKEYPNTKSNFLIQT